MVDSKINKHLVAEVSIPKGEYIFIHKVIKYTHHAINGGDLVVAICSYIDKHGNHHRFEYDWWAGGHITVAPWEQIYKVKRTY
ncbi:hypothetical protein [Aliikangiella sp. IMCC44359]|uniref:hypothetical protein n=1 Tax=Aliikangiella sp. IMCC44359 TaxID=3459125 RepID=UPI00403B1C49